jgi:hypothetical protein
MLKEDEAATGEPEPEPKPNGDGEGNGDEGEEGDGEEGDGEAGAASLEAIQTQMGQMAQTQDRIVSLLEDHGKAIKALQGTDEEKIAAAMSPARPDPAQVEKATASDGNILPEELVKGIFDNAGQGEPQVNPAQQYVNDLLQGRFVTSQ